jgi:hypothetical protein
MEGRGRSSRGTPRASRTGRSAALQHENHEKVAEASNTSRAFPTTRSSLAMDSPDSVAGPSTSAGPSPLSPLKRQGSAPPVDNAAVAQASKKLRGVLLDGADAGKGKGKQEDNTEVKGSLLADLEAPVTCG